MQYSSVGATTLFASDQAAQSEAENSVRTPYVLTIDDDQPIVEVIQLLLESEGYNSFGMSDSLKVPGFLSSLPDNLLPSVILLDLMMPGLSGYDIAGLLSQNERYRHIPIIIMTADSRIHSINNIQGAVDLVAKPFHLQLLLVKLRSYLDPPAP